MRKASFLSIFALAAAAWSQTINPNQIRPGTANGQILTTVVAGQPPLWQAPAANPIALQHNGTLLTDQNLLNFNDTTPAAPAGNTNVTFQANSLGALSAFVPTPAAASTQFSAYLIPPTTGQFINLCSGTQGGSGSDPSQIFTTSPCAGSVTAIGGPIGAPHSSSITWSNYTLPSYVVPANVTAVYAAVMMRAESGGIGSWTFVCNSQAVGTTSVTATKQFNTLLSGINGSNINTVSCTVSASHSGGNVGTFTYVNATVELFAFYTGTAPPVVNQVNIQPPLNWAPDVQVLSLDIPPDTGTDSGTANNYLVTMGGNPLAIPGLTVKFLPGNSSTSTTPTLTLNGVTAGTIVGPRGAALASGDISNTVVAEVILESNGSSPVWSLQNPQSGSITLPNALTMNNSGSGAASGTTFDGSTARTLSYNTLGAAPTASPVFTGTGDASGATQWKQPIAAGFASAANGELGFDSTNNNWHAWNGADRLICPLASGFVSGHCGQPTFTSGKCEVVDTGSACGSASGTAFSALTSGTNTGAAMVVGTGASMAASGSGTIAATSVTSASGLPNGIFSCTEVWSGSGTSSALTSGDDAISNNSCYNDSGSTRTITAVKCRNDNASNTTTVNPTFGSAGTGTTILSAALTCGSSYAYSSSGTVSNASWTTGTGIDPGMGGTLTGTSVAMIVEYHY